MVEFKPLIFVDIDGTVADTLSHIIEYLERKYLLKTTPEDYPTYNFDFLPFLKDKPQIQANLRIMLRDDDFIRSIREYPGAVAGINMLVPHFKVRFLSSRPQASWAATSSWLADKFPKLFALLDYQEQFVYYTNNKHLYAQRYHAWCIIDDGAETCTKTANKRIMVFKVGNKQNRTIPLKTNMRFLQPVSSMHEAAVKILKIKGIQHV